MEKTARANRAGRVLRGFGVLAALGLVASVLLPVEGMGVELCWFYAFFKLPCPGCGLTRSVTAMSHGLPGVAWSFNPFGMVVWGVMLATAPMAFLPAAPRQGVQRFLVEHRRLLRGLALVLMMAMMIHGLLRLVGIIWFGVQFPPVG